jgi:ferric iron reductase protein FhuF
MHLKPQPVNEVREPLAFSDFLAFEFKKKKKKQCCEKYKRKGKRCGSCPLKGCA